MSDDKELEPDIEVVQELEDRLNDALAGDLRGIAFVGVDRVKGVITAHKGNILDDRFRTLGGLLWEAYRILTDIEDDAELLFDASEPDTDPDNETES